jgi:hypothetical protein
MFVRLVKKHSKQGAGGWFIELRIQKPRGIYQRIYATEPVKASLKVRTFHVATAYFRLRDRSDMDQCSHYVPNRTPRKIGLTTLL